MKHDERILRLIAVGASVAANCQPCLQTNATRALECGADEQDIVKAIQVGRMVRKGAASKMDEFASSLDKAAAPSASQADAGCGCGSHDGHA
jgi:AhpD family alkylhydroperoxidase